MADKFKQRLKEQWGCHQLYELIQSQDHEVLPYFDKMTRKSVALQRQCAKAHSLSCWIQNKGTLDLRQAVVLLAVR